MNSENCRDTGKKNIPRPRENTLANNGKYSVSEGRPQNASAKCGNAKHVPMIKMQNGETDRLALDH